MGNWGSCSEERQQGVCDLPKGEGPTPFSFLLCFPWIPDRPPALHTRGWGTPGQARQCQAGGAQQSPQLLPWARQTPKNQNIAPSSSCWINPGSFALRSSPYLEATPSLLPSPCSTGEIKVYFCAQLLPVPHVLPGR